MVLAISRWRRATGLARRTLTPILVSGIMIAPLLGWSALTTSMNAYDLWMPDPMAMVWIQFLTRMVVPVAILVGIFRLGAARATIADLLLDLEAGVPVGGLEAALQRRLHDPSIRLAFAQGDHGLVDTAGMSVDLATLPPDLAATRIDDTDGRPIAYIIHDRALKEDPDLVRAAGTAARLSLENERLQAEVRAQLHEVRELSGRLVTASDAERRRVERDLHDGAQQRLVTLALRLRLARDQVAGDTGVAAMLDDASTELESALAELRELARGIHPAVLMTAGLAGAIRVLAERSPLPVAVDVTEARCGEAVEATAYFVVAEALTNVARHAGATSASVSLGVVNGVLRLVVRDDGIGGASPRGGSGLSGLRDRVVALGGTFDVAGDTGEGTTITVELPCG